MFKKVLIAEDHESTSISVRKTINDLGFTSSRYAYYCDEALKSLRIGLRDQQPFDLLITDLSFEEDYQKQKIADGEALIAAARELQPDLKVLVFSAEHRPVVIDRLFNEMQIDGYVRKARYDAQELKSAITALSQNKKHYPAHLRQAVKEKNAYAFSAFDVTIVSLLSQGMLQKDIPAYLRENQITPSGLSSLEKRLNQIREALGFTKNEQLVAFCKDLGII